MNEEDFQEAVTKWKDMEEAYPDFEEMEKIALRKCSFCKQYGRWCAGCPLNPKYCFNYKLTGHDELYWRIWNKFRDDDKKGLLEMIKAMRKAIDSCHDQVVEVKECPKY